MRILGWLIAGGVLVGLTVALLLRAPKAIAVRPSDSSAAVAPATPLPAAPTPEPEVVARISAASGPAAVVKHLQLHFSFVPPPGQIVSFYNPSDYPTLDAIPLSNGQRASFTSIRRVVFSNLSKRERVFVEEKDRANYVKSAIDKAGYHTVTTSFIQATITTPNGETVADTLECPNQSGVALIGDTAIGSYKMSLWGLKKPLVVDLEPAPVHSAP